MEVSPSHSSLHQKLYRNGTIAVIFAALIGLASSLLVAQDLMPYGRKPPADKGPRALGLVELSPKGKKARFIPIAIMMDGKFYDAGSYKAAPVPMALDFGVVYEGFRTGVSQGIFTITQPGQLNHVWIAEGTWLPAGEQDPRARKKYSAPVIAEEDRDSPPVLHRRVPKNDSDSGSDKKDQQKPASPSPPPPAPAPGTSAPSAPTPPETAKPPAALEATKASAPASAPERPIDEPMQDPNRPRLRRGKPDASEHHEPFTTFDALDGTPGAAPATPSGTGKSDAVAAAAPQIVVMAAISDAGGPDPRPYTYDLKPAEEAIYRHRMLDLATAQLHPLANAPTKNAAPKSKKSSSGKAASTPPQPAFDDVNLRIFDLSSSNEPVLVLSARTQPPAAGAAGSVEPNFVQPREITLIARTNLEGELQKLFFSQTDSQHLDLTPRMELIDAVDADGDGRGELLFRRTFDGGSAYAIYRVTADGLWPLFEGTP